MANQRPCIVGLVLGLFAGMLPGCSGERVWLDPPSSKERRRIESMLQLALPPSADFKLRTHVSGMDPVQEFIFDLPRPDAEALLAAFPLVGNLKDGDRSAPPIPSSIACGPDGPMSGSITELTGRAAAMWNPNGATRFKFGLYKTAGSNPAVVHIFVDLDRSEVVRFYVTCMQ